MISRALEISTPLRPIQRELLSPEARQFIARLVREFGPGVRAVLEARRAEQARLDAGGALGFAETGPRHRAWTVAPIPRDLARRHVEITGPVDRKMVINALGSGADAYMADFEDATAPTFANILDGQVNLRDAVRRTIQFVDEARGKRYALPQEPATLLVRPRGLHLPESHIRLDGRPIPAALFDFGLFFFHNARELLERGSGPYFYLPKLEHHREARLWNDVFNFSQDALGVPRGSVRATVLVETLPAAFQMDEILWELRDHAGGLNCGRWDYIFSFIKTFRSRPDAVLPDRDQIGMTQPFMRAYSRLAIQTCHRRGIHAMGGMAAQIPIRGDEAANRRALERVRVDKLREVEDGHDGTWVAHPGLVRIAREVMAEGMTGDHQIERQLEDLTVTARELTEIPQGERTEAGLRKNVRVGLRYLTAWLGGRGCVPLDHLMEDAATAEISRAQVWQWRRHGARLSDGRRVDGPLVDRVLDEEVARLKVAGSPPELAPASQLFGRLVSSDRLTDFLTLPAYELLRHAAPR